MTSKVKQARAVRKLPTSLYKHEVMYNDRTSAVFYQKRIASFYGPGMLTTLIGKTIVFYTDEPLTSKQRGGLMMVSQAHDMKLNQLETEEK